MKHSKKAFRAAPPTDDGQDYLDRSKLDFDPDDGLLSGTAIDNPPEADADAEPTKA